jgi:ABC-2 type transport system ATP-binding protein
MLAQMKGCLKPEAKNELEYWFDRRTGEQKTRTSQGMAQKNSVCGLCASQTPNLVLTNLSGFGSVNANIIKDEILALRDEEGQLIFSTHRMESVEVVMIILLNHKSNKINRRETRRCETTI